MKIEWIKGADALLRPLTCMPMAKRPLSARQATASIFGRAISKSIVLEMVPAYYLASSLAIKEHTGLFCHNLVTMDSISNEIPRVKIRSCKNIFSTFDFKYIGIK